MTVIYEEGKCELCSNNEVVVAKDEKGSVTKFKICPDCLLRLLSKVE